MFHLTHGILFGNPIQAHPDIDYASPATEYLILLAFTLLSPIIFIIVSKIISWKTANSSKNNVSNDEIDNSNSSKPLASNENNVDTWSNRLITAGILLASVGLALLFLRGSNGLTSSTQTPDNVVHARNFTSKELGLSEVPSEAPIAKLICIALDFVASGVALLLWRIRKRTKKMKVVKQRLAIKHVLLLIFLTILLIAANVVILEYPQWKLNKTIRDEKKKWDVTVSAPDYRLDPQGISLLEYCGNDEAFTIPNTVVIVDPDAFRHASSLKRITIPGGVQGIMLPDDAFDGCSSLQAIEVAENNPDLCSIDGVLFTNDQKELIKVPRGIEKDSYAIPLGVEKIRSSAFANCSSLSTISIPDSVKEIGSYAFEKCSSLTSIVIPEGIKTIKRSTFRGCSSMTSIVLPESVEEIENKSTEITVHLDRVPTTTELQAFERMANSGALKQTPFKGCESLIIRAPVDSYAEQYAKENGINFEPLEDNASKYRLSDDGKVFERYLGKKVRFTIPDGVEFIADKAFEGCSSLKSVVFPASVRATGVQAFLGCDSLTTVILPEGFKEIGWASFEGCSSLESITIPQSVQSINTYAFYNCSSLTSFFIPENVEEIGEGIFSGCSSLKKIDVAKNNSHFLVVDDVLSSTDGTRLIQCPAGVNKQSYRVPDGVVRIGMDSFRGCKSLKSIDVPKGIVDIGWSAFRGCESLTSIVLPKTVAKIEHNAFGECSALEEVVFLNNATSIEEDAFFGCNSLTIRAPKGSAADNFAFDHNIKFEPLRENITSEYRLSEDGKVFIRYFGKGDKFSIPDDVEIISKEAFANCRSLKKIVLPTRVKTIEEGAFGNCSSLTEIAVPESVTSIGNGAFNGCSSLSSIKIPNGVTTIGTNAFMSCSSLKEIVIPESVYTIGVGAFANCVSLEKLVMPKGVILIGFGAFINCVSLTECVVPEGVTTIRDGAFGNCTSLTSISLPKSVDSIGDGAFMECRSLKSITIPEKVKTIAPRTFAGCSSLTEIIVPEGVAEIGDVAFSGCRSLKSIAIPEGAKRIGNGAFKLCSGLTEIAVPNSVSAIGVGAFNECRSLTSFTMPEKITSIEPGVFAGCISLEAITVPKNATSIGDLAFAECLSLKSIGLPADVEKIGQYAFQGCEKLTNVVVPKKVESIGVCAFNGCVSLTSIDVDENNVKYKSVDGVLFTKDGKTLVQYPAKLENERYVIPDGVVTIEPLAFEECSSLKTIVAPESVTAIGALAFTSTKSLISIDVAEDNARYRSVDGILFTKDGKTLVQYPARRESEDYVVPQGVVKISDRAFSSCESLTSVKILEDVVEIGLNAFTYCSSLKAIDVSENNPRYRSTNGILFSKDGQTLVQYPVGRENDVFVVPEGTVVVGDHAFAGSSSLTSVVISKGVKQIENSAFERCSSLSLITIPEEIVAIGGHAFKSCDSLIAFVVPEGVEKIQNGVFMRCTSLSSITIPESVQEIENSAFFECVSLTIRAPKGSYAEQYAKENRINFEPLEETL